MILFLFIVLGIIVISGLLWAYYHYYLQPREQARVEELVLKAERLAQVARPLQDYVANLKPVKRSLIPFKIPFLGNSSPTMANLRRFTALKFSSDADDFYVKDALGTIYGPVDESAIAIWISDERVQAETLLSTHETGPWVPARQVKSFRALFESDISPSIRRRFENIQIK